MFNDCYTRNKEVVSAPPLPFYLFSVGEKRLLRGETAEMGSLKNSFCELVFGISGVGELTLYDKNYLCNPGVVFYYLPGEEHRHHALSAEWTTRWVCFDGPVAAATLLAYQYPRLQRGTGGPGGRPPHGPVLRRAPAHGRDGLPDLPVGPSGGWQPLVHPGPGLCGRRHRPIILRRARGVSPKSGGTAAKPGDSVMLSPKGAKHLFPQRQGTSAGKTFPGAQAHKIHGGCCKRCSSPHDFF